MHRLASAVNRMFQGGHISSEFFQLLKELLFAFTHMSKENIHLAKACFIVVKTEYSLL